MDKKTYDFLRNISDDLYELSKSLDDSEADVICRVMDNLENFIHEARAKYIEESLVKENQMAEKTLNSILDEDGTVLIYNRQGKIKKVTPIAYSQGNETIVHFVDNEDNVVSTHIESLDKDIVSLEYSGAIAIAKALGKPYVTEII